MPSRRCRLGQLIPTKINDTKNNITTSTGSETSKSISDTYMCVLCKMVYSSVLQAPCGHKFCRSCTEEALLPISACPLDNRYVNEIHLAEFVFLQSLSEPETLPEAGKEVEILKARVDSLTVIVNRLIEHMAIRDLLQRAQVLNDKHSDVPLMSDSKFSEPKIDEEFRDLFTCLDLELLQKLSLKNSDDENSKSKLYITSENVRIMLPKFWKIATDRNWSDEEKVQRLRIICDPALQRILDNETIVRKDYAYISSLLNGEHLLDEINMLKYLSSTHQRRGETPFQWYLRVCDIVGRALPPGSDQDREIRSSFLRGLDKIYIDSLGSERFDSIGAILERCSTVNGLTSKPEKAYHNTKSNANKTCFLCYQQGHVQRDCPQNIQNRDFLNEPL